MVCKVEEYLQREESDSESSDSSEHEEDDFMDVISAADSSHRSKISVKAKAEGMVARWLDWKLEDSLHDESFFHEKALKDLFVR